MPSVSLGVAIARPVRQVPLRVVFPKVTAVRGRVSVPSYGVHVGAGHACFGFAKVAPSITNR